MARVTTSKGEAVLRPMLAKDEMLIGELVDLERKDTSYFKIKSRMVKALDAAIIEAPWEGGFGELPKDEILTAILQWDRATEDEALPPDSGTSSETPSEPGS
jgi:hypothetical protein